MSNGLVAEHSFQVRREIDVMLERLKLLSDSLHLTEDAEYTAGTSSLAHSFGGKEPEYDDSDLIWRNPNYVPPG